MNNRKLTRKQYETLKTVEQHLTRGYYGKYVYGLRRKDFDLMTDIYRELGYEKHLDYTCNACLLELTRTLGGLYFSYIKEAEEKKKKIQEKLDKK